MQQINYNATQVHRLASSAASVNATVISDRGGRVMSIRGDNTVASKRYLKFYNKGTAPDQNDVPIATFVIPASGTFAFQLAAPICFPKGLSYRITGAAADNDNTAIAAGDLVQLNIDYDA